MSRKYLGFKFEDYMLFRSITNLLISKNGFIKSIYSKDINPHILSPISEKNLNELYIDESDQIKRVRQKISTTQKKISTNNQNLRIFAAVKQVNWEKEGLVEGWKNIGEVIHYDWAGKYDQNLKNWHTKGKLLFNKELFETVKKIHEEKPINIFFSYLSGQWVFPDTIQKISDLGIITINISLDDSLYFWGYSEDSGLSGNAEIAPYFDICITTQRSIDVCKYIYVGANPLFLPPAANPVNFPLNSYYRDIPISFIGQKYGVRNEIIDYLLSNNIPIEVYGKGWANGEISRERINEIYSRSLINLGFGYIGSGNTLVGLKGRDFEVPISGGLYLTSYNSDLEQCFIIGDEIDFYYDKKDLVNKILYYLNNPDISKSIGIAGQNRCLSHHTWKKRFEKIIDILQF